MKLFNIFVEGDFQMMTLVMMNTFGMTRTTVRLDDPMTSVSTSFLLKKKFPFEPEPINKIMTCIIIIF
jgi:hypothetical protein